MTGKIGIYVKLVLCSIIQFAYVRPNLMPQSPLLRSWDLPTEIGRTYWRTGAVWLDALPAASSDICEYTRKLNPGLLHVSPIALTTEPQVTGVVRFVQNTNFD